MNTLRADLGLIIVISAGLWGRGRSFLRNEYKALISIRPFYLLLVKKIFAGH